MNNDGDKINNNGTNENLDFINAEDSISSVDTPVLENSNEPEQQYSYINDNSNFEDQIDNQENSKKNEKVSFLINTCLIIALITGFVLVITIFTNKDNSFTAFLKTNPIGKVVFKEESTKEIEENKEEVEEQVEEIPVEENKDTIVEEQKESNSSTKSGSSTKKNNNSNSSRSNNAFSNSSSDSSNSSSNSNNVSGNSTPKYDITHYAFIDVDSSNNVRPNEKITRGLVTKWLIKIIGKEYQLSNLSNYPSPFPDVNSSTSNYEYILAAYSLGLVSGNEKGLYKPNDNMTRAEAVAVILKTLDVMGIKKKSTGINREYADVKDSSWYKSFVYKATDYGIAYGSLGSDNKYYFKPESHVSRRQLALMLNRAFDRSDSGLSCDGIPSKNPFNDMSSSDDEYKEMLEGSFDHYCRK